MFDENSMRKQVNDYVWSQPISKRFDYKTMVTVLGIDQAYFNKHRQYFYNLVSDARLNYENRQGLKSLNFHNFRGFIKTEGMCLDREQAVKAGWILTKAKNHCLVFKNSLGRLEWFLNGRVNVWIKKPLNEGKKSQLLADGFFKTGLIYDFAIFNNWVNEWKKKGSHWTVDTGQKLPYIVVDQFQKSNGIVLKLGDKSHPTCAELIIAYPDWAERNEEQHEMTVKRLTESAEVMKTLVEQNKVVTEAIAGITEAKPLSDFRRLYE